MQLFNFRDLTPHRPSTLGDILFSDLLLHIYFLDLIRRIPDNLTLKLPLHYLVLSLVHSLISVAYTVVL